jgi:hypothetical protein
MAVYGELALDELAEVVEVDRCHIVRHVVTCSIDSCVGRIHLRHDERADAGYPEIEILETGRSVGGKVK